MFNQNLDFHPPPWDFFKRGFIYSKDMFDGCWPKSLSIIHEKYACMLCKLLTHFQKLG